MRVLWSKRDVFAKRDTHHNIRRNAHHNIRRNAHHNIRRNAHHKSNHNVIKAFVTRTARPGVYQGRTQSSLMDYRGNISSDNINDEFTNYNKNEPNVILAPVNNYSSYAYINSIKLSLLSLKNQLNPSRGCFALITKKQSKRYTQDFL